MSDEQTIRSDFGPWHVECLPQDGGRISSVKYDGYEFLTSAPADFKAPQQDYGQYELRPVYAYDDCFPSIRPCEHPHRPGVKIRDHGDVCYMTWQVTAGADRLDGSVRSETCPEITFSRSLVFSDDTLDWRYEVSNDGQDDFAFIHVPHPLMPPEKIRSIKLPDFAKAISPMRDGAVIETTNGAQHAEYLLAQPDGSADFMQLLDVASGQVELTWQDGPVLTIDFDTKVFPTLGIWWNRRGYPAEAGIERSECAFEPMPGISASLDECIAEGRYMTVPAGGKTSWNVTWRIRRT